MPFASIDIGSNTINILIAKATDAGLESIFFERIPAQLGKGGMQEGILTEEAIERGLIALKKHSPYRLKWDRLCGAGQKRDRIGD